MYETNVFKKKGVHIMAHSLYSKAEQHIDGNYRRMLDDLKVLASIPAPSNDEIRRAEWIKAYLEKLGAKGVYIDQALNVIYPYCAEDCNQLTAFLAHTDIVFPDTTAITVTEDDEFIHAPGIGDNSTSVICMLEMVRFFLENDIKPDNGFLFVANSGEEGLGNLKGVRQIVADFKGRLKEVVAIDGSAFCAYVNDAVGSKRYRITLKTEGGHSYGAFGNRNAIHYMASMIDTLYTMKVPPIGKTTYNVGLIEGGTSVNTIAQNCTMMYEFRSDKREALEIMDNMFQHVISAYQAMGITVAVELLGDRPCRGDVNTDELEARVCRIGQEVFGTEMSTRAGSTDCNIPLASNIPSICIPAYRGKGAHTREELIYKNSMYQGLRFLAAFMLSYCE